MAKPNDKPCLTKHRNGYKCKLGYRQCVGDTLESAYARWVDCCEQWWGWPKTTSDPNKENNRADVQ